MNQLFFFHSLLPCYWRCHQHRRASTCDWCTSFDLCKPFYIHRVLVALPSNQNNQEEEDEERTQFEWFFSCLNWSSQLSSTRQPTTKTWKRIHLRRKKKKLVSPWCEFLGAHRLRRRRRSMHYFPLRIVCKNFALVVGWYDTACLAASPLPTIHQSRIHFVSIGVSAEQRQKTNNKEN